MGKEVLNGSDGMPQSSEENGLLLEPVSLDEAGEGLPYAPENWPNPGDNWGWRVGKRVSLTGNYVDRYLYLPKRLRSSESSSRKKSFASKLSVARYLETEFPGADIDAFFASFKWKVPANRGRVKGRNSVSLPTDEQIEQYLFESASGGCKAGNKSCITLTEQVEESTVIECDLCCSEPRFCRYCCCILCCKGVDYALGGYSFVKCEAVAEEGRVCAHLAHLKCALRSYMAGKVGGTIGLDTEYYCRRCDAKTDLVPHVAKMLSSCEAVESRDDVEKVLKMMLSVLRGTERSKAKGLLNRVESAISKLNNGTSLEDVWKIEDNHSGLSTDITNNGIIPMEIEHDQDSHNMSARVDWLNESIKLEEEVDQVLLTLKKSQEIEYKLAEDKLYDQKSYITSLYQQLEVERSEQTRHASLADQEALMSMEDQIKQEVSKLKDMEKVASGFGKTSKAILEEHFGLEIEE